MHDEALQEDWETMQPIDRDRYQEREGLEGPFMTRIGKVVYYDPKEGSYYDPDQDIFITYEDWKEMDLPNAPLRNEAKDAPKKMEVTIADKNTNSPAWQRYKAGDPRYIFKGESISEDYSPSDVKQAIAIAAKMGGNMTGAMSAIEKKSKGLSKHKQVKAVLKEQ